MEKLIANWQTELALLDARLADPALYSAADQSQLKMLQKQKHNLTSRIGETEERWLAIQDEIEGVPTAVS